MQAAIKNDNRWVRQAFMLSRRVIQSVDRGRQDDSTAYYKFTDTSLGGNFCINPLPQFNERCDLRMNKGVGGSKGMGRIYSEAFDDNAMKIHCRFGHVEHNTLTGFLSNMYDYATSVLVKTGEGPGFAYTVGRVAGWVVGAPIAAVIATGRFVRDVWKVMQNKNYSKFYYIKGAMMSYWGAVNIICDRIAINMGLGPKINITTANDSGRNEPLSAAERQQWSEVLGDIYDPTGGIDIYAVAGRAQRLNNAFNRRMLALREEFGSEQELMEQLAWERRNGQYLKDDKVGGRTHSQLFQLYEKTKAWSPDPRTDQPAEPVALDENNNPIEGSAPSGTAQLGNTVNHYLRTNEDASSWYDYIEAINQDGQDWVTFRITSDPEFTESFSNSVKDADIMSQFNSFSSGAESTQFSLAKGNFNELVDNTVGAAISTLKDGVMGIAETFGLPAGAADALLGGAMVDIQQHWDSSTATLSSANFSLQLRATYGTKMSIFTNIYVPYAMLLAATLPLSTGKQSYTSPFYCELYFDGRQITRTGMFTDLSATRGVGEVGWSADGYPLGMDVSFTITDLSTILHMPIEPAGMFDDDSSFSDYMAALGGLSLADQIYGSTNIERRLNLQVAKYRDMFNPRRHMGNFHGTIPQRIISMWSNTTSRV